MAPFLDLFQITPPPSLLPTPLGGQIAQRLPPTYRAPSSHTHPLEKNKSGGPRGGMERTLRLACLGPPIKEFWALHRSFGPSFIQSLRILEWIPRSLELWGIGTSLAQSGSAQSAGSECHFLWQSTLNLVNKWQHWVDNPVFLLPCPPN